ncbi:vesicle-associated membrane protein 4 [Petromyzon marinus]|uniref:Vesicle-associated membrane protein 4 n=1 Tax=Petromyzon marinus TaxID=7757 RepID=A0AAJ7WKK1_PETMA|nr:vesicle-associated membrane protein 4 [Petromyzon marinus]
MPPKFKRHLRDEEVIGSGSSERRNLLADDDSEGEDFFLTGPTIPRLPQRSDAITQVQGRVDEVVDVMRSNIVRAVERGQKLEELNLQSEELSDSASAFHAQSTRLQRRLWWQQCKMKLVFGAIIVVIILIIVVPIIIKQQH